METEKARVRQRIKQLSRQAYEYAVARFQKNAPLDEEDLRELIRLQEELRKIGSDLRASDPKMHEEVSDAISEGLLDFNYAVDAPPITSMRLHHYLESEEIRKRSNE
jgi:hypothetical protein